MKLKLLGLSLITCISLVNAQDIYQYKTANSDSEAQTLLNNPQIQNVNELVMFIMQSLEDRNITDSDKKVDFINSFKVSDDIKHQAISYVKQNLSYSDYERVSYGIFRLKNCQQHKTSFNASFVSISDHIKSGNQCFVYPLFDCNL